MNLVTLFPFSVSSSPIEPQHYNQAKNDENWVLAMKKEIIAHYYKKA